MQPFSTVKIDRTIPDLRSPNGSPHTHTDSFAAEDGFTLVSDGAWLRIAYGARVRLLPVSRLVYGEPAEAAPAPAVDAKRGKAK